MLAMRNWYILICTVITSHFICANSWANLFYCIYFINSNLCLNSSTRTSDGLLTSLNDGEQRVLDVGQKDFGAKQCPECGLLYDKTDPDDVRVHDMQHNRIMTSLTFKVNCLTFKVNCLTFKINCLTFKVNCLTFKINCLAFKVNCLTFMINCLTFKVNCLTFKINCLTFKIV